MGKVFNLSSIKMDMNIDEFLDTALQDEDMRRIQEEELPINGDIKKESIKEESVADKSDKEDEYNIKHYSGLWKKISEAKFKWDANLYTELNKEGNKVKEKLSKLSITIGREKREIKRLIGRSLIELENKNYDAATKLYSEITDMRNKFPDFLLEDKKEINKEIFMLYEKLHDQVDSKFIDGLKDSIAQIDNLIRDSHSNLDKGDVDKAKVFYENALEVYRSLPNGFLQQKMELGDELLKLYKALSIQTQIKDLQQQLSKKSSQSYKYMDSEDRLKHLSEAVRDRVSRSQRKKAAFPDLNAIPARENQSVYDPSLLSTLVARKLKRAKTSFKKELYLEAKKNINSILKVDPNNAEAKQLLEKLPVEY